MKREGSPALGFYTIGIAALFLAGFFLLVAFGAQSYRDTVSGQHGNMDSRALLSYLSTTVKGYDAAGAVRIEEGAAGPTLVLLDGESGYALRVYRHEGALVEDYAAADAPLQPSEAQVIGQTARFEITAERPDLLRVSTDAGDVLLFLRCGGAA